MGTVRRIITGHDKDGTAVILQDGQINTVARTGGIGSAVLWITEESPADMSSAKDRVRAIGVPPPAA